jgi:methionyl-tRNA formyltransferase
MSPELDAGRIVAQRSIEGAGNSSVFALTARLFREGAELLAGVVESIAGGATGRPQRGVGSYQSWPTRGEVRQLRGRGGALLHLSDLIRFKSFT